MKNVRQKIWLRGASAFFFCVLALMGFIIPDPTYAASTIADPVMVNPPIARGDAVAIVYCTARDHVTCVNNSSIAQQVHNGAALAPLMPGPPAPTAGGAPVAHVARYPATGPVVEPKCFHHNIVPEPGDWMLISVLRYLPTIVFPQSQLNKVRNISGAFTDPTTVHPVHIQQPIAYKANAEQAHNGAFVRFQLVNTQTNTVIQNAFSASDAEKLAPLTFTAHRAGILYLAHYANPSGGRAPGPFFYQGRIVFGNIRLAWIHGSLLPPTISCL